jgi:molecular chaperone GrpE
MVDEKEPQPVNFEELLETEKKRSEDYLTRLRYLQADYENQKKRFERESEQTKNYCTERIITSLLDVVDELELAVKNGEISTDPESLIAGVELTLKKLRKVLEQEGVTAIESPQGKTFDPSRHNAVVTQETVDVPECTVLEEIRKGYIMRGRVIRPTIVKVAVKPTKKENPSNQKSEEKNNE